MEKGANVGESGRARTHIAGSDAGEAAVLRLLPSPPAGPLLATAISEAADCFACSSPFRLDSRKDLRGGFEGGLGFRVYGLGFRHNLRQTLTEARRGRDRVTKRLRSR